MQTPVKATQAHEHKAPVIPALMPNPPVLKANRAIFWAAFALNDDALLQALDSIAKTFQEDHSSSGHTKRVALTLAREHRQIEAHNFFAECRNAGGLLFAWRGSRALTPALPDSLHTGGAA